MSIRRRIALAAAVAFAAAACHSNRPQLPPPPPPPLSDSAAAALRWIDGHAVSIATLDSTRPADDRAAFVGFVGDAHVLGVSELVEGTRAFPEIMQAMLATLAQRSGFRGIAVQAPMPEAMEVDRYVRTGVGNPRAALHVLGSHWETQGVVNLVHWLRGYNSTRPESDQIGFYGFELPNGTHAVQVVTTLADSVAGGPLNRWLREQMQCVTTGESAAWGREGAAADSTFWNRCRGITASVVDSLGALRARIAPGRTAALQQVRFAELMASVAQHDVDVGLRHLPRQEVVARHILWLADRQGPSANLLVWGRDVESGRLTLEGGGPSVVQSAVPLSHTLGERYRNLAFTVGDGVVRASPIAVGQREPGSERDMTLRRPTSGSYEDVLIRASADNFFLDLRALPADTAGEWLKGPHPARLVSSVYSESPLGSFQTPLEFPAYYDGFLFVKHAAPAVPAKR
jgi:erythromycin esterase-like protein